MDDEPDLPIPISYIGSKYLLFDINIVTWLRKVHNICGVMTGTLPQSPSQNLFLGLPVHIMPEEAQLLVEKGVAYIVDDAKAHDLALQQSDEARQSAYLAQLRKKGELVSQARYEEKQASRLQSLKKANAKGRPKPDSDKDSSTNEDRDGLKADPESGLLTPIKEVEDDIEVTASLFDSPTTSKHRPPTPKQLPPHNVIPTTSEIWLPTPPPDSPEPPHSMALLPNVPPSYALYKHLNSRSYFITPGLRFGCQYCVYPGDPLRFHSHFLAVGTEWDQEIDLMDIVGGGRLGTGVKKGFLIGGREPATAEGEEGRMRTFSIEWAAM